MSSAKGGLCATGRDQAPEFKVLAQNCIRRFTNTAGLCLHYFRFTVIIAIFFDARKCNFQSELSPRRCGLGNYLLLKAGQLDKGSGL